MEAEAQAQGTEASAAGDAQSGVIAGLESLGLFEGVAPAEAEAAPAEAPAAAVASQAEEVDPLDDSLFGDDRLSTPEGVRQARERILAEKKKANELRKKAHNAHAAAEAREAKFKRTKEQTLALQQSVRGREALIDSELKAIQSGDVEAFIRGVAKLSGATDPHKFWRETSIHLARGGKLAEPEEGRPDPALQREIEQIKATLESQATAAAQQRVAQQEAQILQLRADQVEWAQQSDEHPFVSTIANQNPVGIDEALMKIKMEEHARTGRAIDTATACGLLETELKAQYDLFQRANGSSGISNGERGTAGSVPDRGRETTATAKPGTPQSQAQAHRHVTIPASLSAEPAVSKRPTTREEERQVKIAGLSSLGFFD